VPVVRVPASVVTPLTADEALRGADREVDDEMVVVERAEEYEDDATCVCVALSVPVVRGVAVVLMEMSMTPMLEPKLGASLELKGMMDSIG
jgi:hypothetical protein